MANQLDELLRRYELKVQGPAIRRHERPAVGLSLTPTRNGRSRFGGSPLLPPDFVWPSSTPLKKELPLLPGKGASGRPGDRKPLDCLLQIELTEIPPQARWADCPLPASGLLTFFYDTENQPWGYNPAQLDGFRVALFEKGPLAERLPPGRAPLPPRGIRFFPSLTIPRFGSRAYEELEAEVDLPDSYHELVDHLEREGYPDGAGLHRLLGHAANIQGDMQLEAQLVSHGLYCGDEFGRRDPRSAKLALEASDWILLLQFDSEDDVELMWGDCGMIYFWIRRQDLAAGRFDRTWVGLQCS